MNGSEQTVLLPYNKQTRTDANTASVRVCSMSSKDLELMHHIQNIAPCQRSKSVLDSHKHFRSSGWLSHIDALKMSGVLLSRERISPPSRPERRTLIQAR